MAEIPDFSKTGNEIVLKDIFIPKDEVQVFYFRTHTALDAEKHGGIIKIASGSRREKWMSTFRPYQPVAGLIRC